MPRAAHIGRRRQGTSREVASRLCLAASIGGTVCAELVIPPSGVGH